MSKSYDDLCADATSAAETRLLEHYVRRPLPDCKALLMAHSHALPTTQKLHGGEVWTIGSGCQSCRQKLEDTSALKVRGSCAARCGRHVC